MSLGRFIQGASSGAIWVLGLALIDDTHKVEEMGVNMSFIFTGMSYWIGGYLCTISYMMRIGMGDRFHLSPENIGLAFIACILPEVIIKAASSKDKIVGSMRATPNNFLYNNVVKG